MSHPRRPAVSGLLALCLASALTGCGAGLQAQTYRERTVADSTNANLGDLAVRNVSVLAPAGGRIYPAGSQARGVLRVANNGSQPDRLLGVTSEAATEVVLLDGGRPSEVAVPARGSTQDAASFLLRGLVKPLGTGEYVTLTLRFARSGTLDVLVPVAVTGRSQRPGRTGEPGSPEGEPALQGPAGGKKEAAGGAATEPGGGGSAERGPGEPGTAGSSGASAPPAG